MVLWFFCPCRLSHTNPSAVQNSKDVCTLFQRRPSKKTRKRLQKLGLTCQVLEPFTPHQKKHAKKKAPMHHANLVYVNPSSGGSESSQVGVSASSGSLSPHSSAVREASQAQPVAKLKIQAFPTVDKTHTPL